MLSSAVDKTQIEWNKLNKYKATDGIDTMMCDKVRIQCKV